MGAICVGSGVLEHLPRKREAPSSNRGPRPVGSAEGTGVRAEGVLWLLVEVRIWSYSALLW
jgi:hypothetical protein